MSLIETRINDIVAQGRLDKHELRPSRYGGVDLFMQQGADPMGIITPDLRNRAAASMGVNVEVPVIDYDNAISIGSTRNAVIADSENTSHKVVVSFTTYAFGFTMVPALYGTNEIGYDQDFAAKLTKYINALAAQMDTDALAALALNKTTVFNDSLQYAVAGDALQVAYADREGILGDLNPILAANDFYDQIHLVGNTGVESIIRKLSEKGLYNSENRQLEYSDKVLHFTNRLGNGVGEYANLYAVPAGTVGMLTRVERDSLMGTTMADGTQWGTATLPMIGLPVGTYYYESRGDFSGIAGAASSHLTRSYKQHYGFAVDVAYMVAYNSDPVTRPGGITKATVLVAP